MTAGRYEDGWPRRLYRTIRASNEAEAVAQLNAFLVEVNEGQANAHQRVRSC